MLIDSTFADSKVIVAGPKYLWFLMVAYSMVIVLANWFDPRLISLWGLDTDAGTLIFPFTFMLSDLITEVYGYKQARRAIWCGFLFSALFVFYGLLVTHIPGPEYASSNAVFDEVHLMNARLAIAGYVAYFSSEPFNSLLMAKFKIKFQGRYMAIRFVISTIIASGIDSVIFTFIAFYSLMTSKILLGLALSMWLIKVSIEIMILPISIRIAKKLKKSEQLDIYDRKTNFNIFSFDGQYMNKENEFSIPESRCNDDK